MKKYFYEINVIALTVVLPVSSALIEMASLQLWDLETLLIVLGKWIVFWALGIRLLLAGITQIVKPEFTSKVILGIKDPEAGQVVRELGFANFSMGVAGVMTLILSPAIMFIWWTVAVALIGGLFLGLDGIEHIRKKKRNGKENLAMVTDFFVAVVALSFSIYLLTAQLSIPSYG